MSGGWRKWLYPVKGGERRSQPGGGMKRIEEVFGAKLREFTTVGIGGAAERLVFPRSVREIQEILASERAANREVKALGGGSNLLVSDGGVRGPGGCLKKNTGKGFFASGGRGGR